MSSLTKKLLMPPKMPVAVQKLIAQNQTQSNFSYSCCDYFQSLWSPRTSSWV